jgi:hypothetical protein
MDTAGNGIVTHLDLPIAGYLCTDCNHCQPSIVQTLLENHASAEPSYIPGDNKPADGYSWQWHSHGIREVPFP